MTELGKVEKDVAGFETISFWDGLGKLVGLQVTERVVLFPRMGINRDQVRALVTTLQRWLDTGSFAPPERVEVVTGNGDKWLDPLANAIHNCKHGTVIVVASERIAHIGRCIAFEFYGSKGLVFTVKSND